MTVSTHPEPAAIGPYVFDAEAARTIVPRDYQNELIASLVREVSVVSPGAKLVVQLATGGGKSLVANEFIWNVAVRDGCRVLVVTKDWQLLSQFASDLCKRYKHAASFVGYVGGADGAHAFDGLPNDPNKAVVFTTLQSWAARRSVFEHETFQFVVIDELHWGEGAVLQGGLMDLYQSDAIFIGLTATPRSWTDFRMVGRGISFKELVDKQVLAQPIVCAPLRTGVQWSPRTSGPRGDVVADSLRELSTSAARNGKIVRTYLDRRGDFGKTIVFACDVAHASALSSAFVDSGVPSVALHSKLDAAKRQQARTAFETGSVDVLVNVAMMTHGVDIPDIRSVFLARPTQSQILFSQMIGRGARLAPGKTSFNIVDFVDATNGNGVALVRAEGFLGSGVLVPCPPLLEHDCTPAPIEIVPVIPRYEEIAGLEIQPEQTFGIEFEMAPCRRRRSGHVPRPWAVNAQRVLDALRAVVPTAEKPMDSPRGGNHAVWNIKCDASCGYEVTTRILKGTAGLVEVVDALRALGPIAAELGLEVNIKTGTHVHLGWSDETPPIQRLIYLAAYYEPAILSLVAPSRARSLYTQSTLRELRRMVRANIPPREWVTHWRRYTGVNLCNLPRGYRTVEIRLHSGTLEAPKILTWLSLWMRMFAAAHDPNARIPENATRRLHRAPLCPGPRGDVEALCLALGVGDELIQRLLRRRAHVVSHWWARDPKYRARAISMLRIWGPTISAYLGPGIHEAIHRSEEGMQHDASVSA